MPIITLEGPSIADLDKKRQLVKSLTEAAVGAYGLPAETMVVIVKENRPDNVGLGGVLITDR